MTGAQSAHKPFDAAGGFSDMETEIRDIAAMLQICALLVDVVNADMLTWEKGNIPLKMIRTGPLQDRRDLLTWATYHAEEMSRDLVARYEEDVQD